MDKTFELFGHEVNLRILEDRRAFVCVNEHRLCTLEWNLRNHTLAAGLNVDPSEGDIVMNVGVPPARVFLVAHTSKLAQRLCPDRDERSLQVYMDFKSVCVGGPHLHWQFWTPSGHWENTTPFWRDGSLLLAETVFGQAKMTERVLMERPVAIPMPEGVYVGHAKLVEATWRLPRWPRVWDRVRRVHIEVPQGIPVPGKGENSWDLDEDATYGFTTAARTIEQAVGTLVGDVLSDRRHRAGENWRPSKRVRRDLSKPSTRSKGFIMGSTTPVDLEYWDWLIRDPLTGRWDSWGTLDMATARAMTDYEIDEPDCGCCHAKYGEPCKDYHGGECPNLHLRTVTKFGDVTPRPAEVAA